MCAYLNSFLYLFLFSSRFSFAASLAPFLISADDLGAHFAEKTSALGGKLDHLSAQVCLFFLFHSPLTWVRLVGIQSPEMVLVQSYQLRTAHPQLGNRSTSSACGHSSWLASWRAVCMSFSGGRVSLPSCTFSVPASRSFSLSLLCFPEPSPQATSLLGWH